MPLIAMVIVVYTILIFVFSVDKTKISGRHNYFTGTFFGASTLATTRATSLGLGIASPFFLRLTYPKI